MTCKDCPFTAEDKKARNLSDEKYEEILKIVAPDVGQCSFRDKNNKLWLTTSHPCKAMKAISFVCQLEMDVPNLIIALSAYLGSKKGVYGEGDKRIIRNIKKYLGNYAVGVI